MEIIQRMPASVAHSAPSVQPRLHQRHGLLDAYSAVGTVPSAQRGRRNGEDNHAAQSHKRHGERQRKSPSKAGGGALDSQHNCQQADAVDPLARFAVPPQNFLLAGGFFQPRPLADTRPHLSAHRPACSRGSVPATKHDYENKGVQPVHRSIDATKSLGRGVRAYSETPHSAIAPA